MSDVAVLVPMLGRAPLVARLRESIVSTCDARIVWLVTPSDSVIATVESLGDDVISVPRKPAGDYARKINTGYRATTEPLLMLAAIDVVFRPGWLEAAVAELRPGIGVVGTNDLGSPRVMAGEHATHSLVTREYADRFGTIDRPGEILHEGYPHEWVDDELVGTAKKRGAWAFAHGSHVEHLHPNWGKAPTDLLYAQQRQRMRKGANLYVRRRRLWT